MTFERIKFLREERGLSQQELAYIIGVAQSSIGNYERGSRIPDAEVILKMCNYFSVSADYLLGRIEQKWLENVPVNELTGLDDAAISNLNSIHDSKSIVNLFIGYDYFPRFIDDLGNYITADNGMDLDPPPRIRDKTVSLSEMMLHVAIRDFERVLNDLRETVQNNPDLLAKIEQEYEATNGID